MRRTMIFTASLACLALCTSAAHAIPVVANGDFETNANLFTQFPGYVGQGGNPAAVTSFTSSNGASNQLNYGINPGNGAGDPFRDNGADNSNVLFIQDGSNVISQAISGFTPGAKYQLDFDYNARACCGGTAAITVALGVGSFNDPLDTPVANSGNHTGALHHGLFQFIAGGSGTETLSITKSDAIAGDSTATFDNFVISAVPEPASLVLFGLGGLGLVMAARRRRTA